MLWLMIEGRLAVYGKFHCRDWRGHQVSGSRKAASSTQTTFTFCIKLTPLSLPTSAKITFTFYTNELNFYFLHQLIPLSLSKIDLHFLLKIWPSILVCQDLCLSELIAYLIMCVNCNHFHFLAEIFCNHASVNSTGWANKWRGCFGCSIRGR